MNFAEVPDVRDTLQVICHRCQGQLWSFVTQRLANREPVAGGPALPKVGHQQHLFEFLLNFHILRFGSLARFITLCMVHCPAWWDWNTANSNIPSSVAFKIWLTMSDFRDSDSEDSSDRPVQVMASRNFPRSASFSNLLSLAGSDAIWAGGRPLEAKREFWHSEIVSFLLRENFKILAKKLKWTVKRKVYIFSSEKQLSKEVKTILRWISLQTVFAWSERWILQTFYMNHNFSA